MALKVVYHPPEGHFRHHKVLGAGRETNIARIWVVDRHGCVSQSWEDFVENCDIEGEFSQVISTLGNLQGPTREANSK
jgi:hypothetical protein